MVEWPAAAARVAPRSLESGEIEEAAYNRCAAETVYGCISGAYHSSLAAAVRFASNGAAPKRVSAFMAIDDPKSALADLTARVHAMRDSL